jgi:hypothetical protein
MAGAADAHIINPLVTHHTLPFALAKYESLQLSIRLLTYLSTSSSCTHMSLAPPIASPLRQTTRLLHDHLPHALADIAEGYLLPKDMKFTWSIIEAGHYELCMEVKHVNEGLAYACRYGHMDIVQLMIAKGASNWNHGLSNACHSGHMDIVQLMIAKGTSNWNRGLTFACYDGHMDIVQLMIDKGASNWNSGLSSACANSHMDIVQLMIAKGATTCSTCDNAKHSFSH